MLRIDDKIRVKRPFHPTNCFKMSRVRQGLFLYEISKELKYINFSIEVR